MIPGHEIAGRVVAVGKDVMKFKVGDYAGVGCMVDVWRNVSDGKVKFRYVIDMSTIG